MSKYSFELRRNGASIDTNDFVNRAFSGTVIGMVSSLDGLPSKLETIEIRIAEKK
ncbi:MAG: hypothetical protein ACFFB3_01055 [Candidatus Hodarchaeota archaeon]